MKPRPPLCLALVLTGLIVCSLAAGQSTGEAHANGWQTKTSASESQLDSVIAQLQNPATRFDAFVALLEFAGYLRGNIYSQDVKVNTLHEKAINARRACPGLDTVMATMIDRLKEPDDRIPMLRDLLRFSEPYQMNVFNGGTGNRSLDELLAKINQALNAAFDPPTVEKALGDSDWLLRMTAVNHFGNSPPDTNAWVPLLPEMEKLAVDDDASIRSAADRKLQEFPGTEKFLDWRLTNETSAEVILKLLTDHGDGRELSRRFLPLFVPLLKHPDEKVREDALLFIGSNSRRAPMLQIAFGMDVFNQVIASTQAKSAKERVAAAEALANIRQLDMDRSREAFLRLTNDPDADVRWRIASGLNNQLEREDVKHAIDALVKDKSPKVRYMTILAVGPQKFVPELEVLSKSADPWVAESAAQKLNQLANEKKN